MTSRGDNDAARDQEDCTCRYYCCCCFLYIYNLCTRDNIPELYNNNIYLGIYIKKKLRPPCPIVLVALYNIIINHPKLVVTCQTPPPPQRSHCRDRRYTRGFSVTPAEETSHGIVTRLTPKHHAHKHTNTSAHIQTHTPGRHYTYIEPP